jgi:deoxyribodipyrimidine photo-lyase
VDYDVASNNGNWQWIASTGADSQPFFRIFNPTEQGKTVDPNCEYIKKWIPELNDVEPNIIHNWETEWKENKHF